MHFTMQTDCYSNNFSMITPRLGFCERSHMWPESTKGEIDILGPFWALAFFKSDQSTLSFEKDGDLLRAKKDHAVFIPPFQIFSTKIQPGDLAWNAYFSNESIPGNLPSVPVYLPWDSSQKHLGVISLFQKIDEQRENWIIFEKRKTGSRVALRTKLWIDENYRNESSFAELSQILGLDQSVIGREFRQCYGLSPSQYRKKLRTTSAMISMVLCGESVTSAGSRVGYGDLDHFTKQFRANLLALPSQFKPPKEFYEKSEIDYARSGLTVAEMANTDQNDF